MKVWTPLLVAPYEQTDGTNRATVTYPIRALGRLRAGVALQQAAMEARVVVRRAQLAVTGQADQGSATAVEVIPLQEECAVHGRPS